MNNSNSSTPAADTLVTELERLRRHRDYFERTELVAHIGQFEWSNELDCLLSCSNEYARIHGMTVEEILLAHSSSEKVLELIHPEDRERFVKNLDAAQGSQVLNVEYRIRLASGEVRHVREYSIQICDDDGKVIGAFGILQDVSDIVQTKNQLEYRDELARQTEAITDIGHFIFNEDNGCYDYISSGCARIYGYSPEAYKRKVQSVEDDLADILPEDRARVAEEYQNFVASGEDCAVEFRIRREDGAIRWVRELTRAKRFENGRVSQTLGVVQDITDRVKREHELVFKDAMARQAESMTDIGYFLFDLRRDSYAFVSLGQARIYGMSLEDYQQRIRRLDDFLELVDAEDREAVRQAYQLSLQQDGGWEIEYRIKRQDGETRWVREIGRAHLRDVDGVRQVIGVAQDITGRRQIEQELLFKDALANQAEQITDIGHFIYDGIQDKYLFISDGMARIHGRTIEELSRRNLSVDGELDLVHPEDRDHVRKAYLQFLAGEHEWRVDYRLICGDGEIRWVREVGRAHRMKHGIPEQTLGVLQDITERKQVEREILEARDTLENKVVERTRELANTVKQLQIEIQEREKIAAELDFLANHDALTGLPSLRLCKDRLNQSLAEARRNRQTSAVMFLDLDGFKEINDQHGHEFGDQVLKVTANRIMAEIRETDTVARIGGDEFVIILSSLPQVDTISRIAAQMIESVARPIQINSASARLSASIGISLYPENGTTAEELIRSADKAMYAIKREGKNGYGFVDKIAKIVQIGAAKRPSTE